MQGSEVKGNNGKSGGKEKNRFATIEGQGIVGGGPTNQDLTLYSTIFAKIYGRLLLLALIS